MTHTERLQLAMTLDPGMDKQGAKWLGGFMRSGVKSLGNWLNTKSRTGTPLLGNWMGRKGNELVTASGADANILGSTFKSLINPTGKKPVDFVLRQGLNPFSMTSLMGFNPVNRFGPAAVGKYYDGSLGFMESSAQKEMAQAIAHQYSQIPWYQRLGMSFNPETFARAIPQLPNE